MQNELKVQLVHYKGGIHIQVFAKVENNGVLSVYGFDSGDLPVSAAWDNDVEYGLDIAKEEKSKVKYELLEILKVESREFTPDQRKSEDENLLHLLAFVYQGRRRTFDEFKDLVEKKNIKHSFWWW